jgi:long-chain acyl-CoA synthetase
VGPAVKDTICKIGDGGELLLKGPQVMMGYYKNPEATREAFTPDGFFRTGDIAEIDKDGYVKITGRLKDIIVTSGGKNISPQNIENSLKASKYIEQVAIGDNRSIFSPHRHRIHEIEDGERQYVQFASAGKLWRTRRSRICTPERSRN